MTVHLNRVLKDGSEDGASVADKINATMEQAELNAKVYEYNRTEKVTIPNDTYTQIGAIVKAVSDGIFEVGFNVAWTMSSTTKSVLTRLTINGVVASELSTEIKDKTNVNTATIMVPLEITSAETLDIRLEMRKEANTGVCESVSALLWIEKKL